MARYRVRKRNIRLFGEYSDGSEFLRDFETLGEAQRAVPSDLVDWAIFEIDHPEVAGVRGRVLEQTPTGVPPLGGRRKASRSKPKRAGAKKRTVTRLKRRWHLGPHPKGYGVMRHGVDAPRYGGAVKRYQVSHWRGRQRLSEARYQTLVQAQDKAQLLQHEASPGDIVQISDLGTSHKDVLSIKRV